MQTLRENVKGFLCTKRIVSLLKKGGTMHYENVWRRQETRFKCSMPLSDRQGTIKNLSHTGACVCLPKKDLLKYNVGDSVTLWTSKLAADGAVTELNGRIVYKADRGTLFRKPHCGLQINRNTAVDRFILGALTNKSRKSYAILARWYEGITAFLTFDYVLKVKRYSLKYLRPGDKVLIAGCGGGKFSSEVARKEVTLHCLDISSEMIAETKKRIAELKQPAAKVEYFNRNVLQHTEFNAYDVVYLNYILNVFSFDIMLEVLKHNLKLIKPGGLLIVSDEKPVSEFIFPFNVLYWPLRILTWAFVYCLPTKTPLHNVYNYTKIIAQLKDFKIVETKDMFAQRIIISKKMR